MTIAVQVTHPEKHGELQVTRQAVNGDGKWVDTSDAVIKIGPGESTIVYVHSTGRCIVEEVINKEFKLDSRATK